MSDVLPEGWAITKLAELLEPAGLFDGPFGSNLKTSDYTNTGVRVVRLENIASLRFVEEKRTFISMSKYASLKKHTLFEGDLIVGSFVDGAVRVCVLPSLPTTAIAKADCFCVRTRPELDRKFLAFQLGADRTRDALIEEIHGATRPRITTRQLRNFEILAAPLPEQRRIVERVEALLVRVNVARDRLVKVPAILKQFRQSVLDAACSRRLTADWRAARRTSEEWRDLGLGQVLREPLRNGHSAKKSPDGKGVPTFTLSAFTDGDFSHANIKMTVADPKKVQDLWAEPNDIYVERSNTPQLVGTARLYNGSPRRAIVPDLVIRVRVRTEDAVPRFIEHCLRSESGRKYFIDRAQGTAGSMPKIDQSVVAAFPISLPPRDEQEEIVRRVEALFVVADAIERRVGAATARADKMTQAILAKAFKGELVPTEAELARQEGRDYEPAAALLERVKSEGEGASRPSVGKRRRTRKVDRETRRHAKSKTPA